MTREDKELIRLAARAFFGAEDEATHAVVSLGWNPLANNEDAFMLLVWTGANFETLDRGNEWASAHAFAAEHEHMESASEHADLYAAARRAIVRAAASIGSALA